MSLLIQLLDRPIAYQAAFAKLRVGKVRSGPVAAVLLSQFVYWHNRMNGDWMYKTRDDIQQETGLSRDEQETARRRLVTLGVLEEKLCGIPATLHFRVNAERLEQLLLSPGQAESQLEGMPPTRKRKSTQQAGGRSTNNQGGNQPTGEAEPHQQAGAETPNFHTGDYAETTAKTTAEIKTQREGRCSVDNFSGGEDLESDKSGLALQEDFDLARWFWSSIVELYERAAEYDGAIVRPAEPNWAVWANEIRLLRAEHGCDHDQIRGVIQRVQSSEIWCKQIQKPRQLRARWAELVLRVCSGDLTKRRDPFGGSYKYGPVPPGFRG